MFKHARKFPMVISLILILVMPFMLAAAPGQDTLPEGEAGEVAETEDAFDMLAPAVDLAGKVVVIAVGVAVFLLGTVQGVNVVKWFLPKGGWEWYKNARPGMIKVLSFGVAMFLMIGSKVDLFDTLAEINGMLDVDPIFSQFLAGGTLSYASNWFYDNFVDEEN